MVNFGVTVMQQEATGSLSGSDVRPGIEQHLRTAIGFAATWRRITPGEHAEEGRGDAGGSH